MIIDAVWSIAGPGKLTQLYGIKRLFSTLGFEGMMKVVRLAKYSHEYRHLFAKQIR